MQTQKKPPAQLKPVAQDGVDARAEHLRAVSLFEEIRSEPGALEELAQVMQIRRYEPGTAIIKEGESGSEMYLLIEGEASVYKSTAEGDLYKVAILQSKSHAFFGEGGLLDSDSRSATITAETTCACLVLERPQFEAFGSKYPEWALPILSKIARAVLHRLRKTNNDLTLLYNALVAEIRGS